jgi:hypothetical protein
MSYRRQIVTRRPAAPVAVALQKLRQGLTGGRLPMALETAARER